MSESTETFAELFSKGPSSIKEGEVSRGVVLSVDEDYVQVDIGFKSEGLVAAWEFMTEEGEMTVKVGDTVLIGKYAGTEIKIDGDEYQILREDEILGVIDN